jgi:hypothetical protein
MYTSICSSVVLFGVLLALPGMAPVKESSALAQATGRSESQTFVTFIYQDPQAGMEAFRLLIPKGWNGEGAIQWSANPALPAQSQFRFYNPKSSEEFNLFPTQSYFWTNNRMFLTTNPPGTVRFGTWVAEPVNLPTAFRQFVLANFRNRITDLQILVEKPVPELVELAKGEPTPGVNAVAEGGKIRVQYNDHGNAMEEEFYSVVSQFVTPMPASVMSGGYYINYWFIDYTFSFKAARGQLEQNSKIFQTMVFSLQVNPRWLAKVIHVKERLAQMYMQGIRTIGHIGSVIANTGSEIREQDQRFWEQRQQANERVVDNFCDHIRGVERYNDPFSGNEVELPSGYSHAWANNLGEYIVTDNPNFNPNVGSNLHWESLPAKP